jgi:hypothetical protein
MLAAPTPRAEREDDQTNKSGALVLENRPASSPTTGNEEISMGEWKYVSRKNNKLKENQPTIHSRRLLSSPIL